MYSFAVNFAEIKSMLRWNKRVGKTNFVNYSNVKKKVFVLYISNCFNFLLKF